MEYEFGLGRSGFRSLDCKHLDMQALGRRHAFLSHLLLTPREKPKPTTGFCPGSLAQVLANSLSHHSTSGIVIPEPVVKTLN